MLCKAEARVRITHLKSATVLIEAGGLKILTDPWLVDGEYYGAWAHYPPYRFRPRQFADVDYIYISHVHPDHMSVKTLRLLDTRIPVLIHSYESKFLKRHLESLGFTVTELPNNRRTELRDGVHINILAADNCNPELCARFFGCGVIETRYGSAQLDSLSVIDDGRPCSSTSTTAPWSWRGAASRRFGTHTRRSTFSWWAMGARAPTPQCFASLGVEEKRAAAARKARWFLDQGASYISLLKPRYYMPFAGTYALAGKLAPLAAYRGVPELHEAAAYFRASTKIDQAASRCVLLNTEAHFDLAAERASMPYEPIAPDAREAYIREELAPRHLDYEDDPVPDPDELLELVPGAYDRMESKRLEIGFSSDTRVRIHVADNRVVELSMNGNGHETRRTSDLAEAKPYISFRTDHRLLKRLLMGPRHAHWNNAEIGSHVEFRREPDQYERGLHHAVCFLHV